MKSEIQYTIYESGIQYPIYNSNNCETGETGKRVRKGKVQCNKEAFLIIVKLARTIVEVVRIVVEVFRKNKEVFRTNKETLRIIREVHRINQGAVCISKGRLFIGAGRVRTGKGTKEMIFGKRQIPQNGYYAGQIWVSYIYYTLKI